VIDVKDGKAHEVQAASNLTEDVFKNFMRTAVEAMNDGNMERVVFTDGETLQ
jgi:hypothetical protein